MDSHFGPAWIGFAHTFAAEGEHDQAISAYSTAARLFQGSHLPQLFLGMQNLQLNNLGLAREYLNTAYLLCKTDPLLLNELGIVAFHSTDHTAAIDFFRSALAFSAQNGADTPPKSPSGPTSPTPCAARARSTTRSPSSTPCCAPACATPPSSPPRASPCSN